jgi:opacity protein-like surface antigen
MKSLLVFAMLSLSSAIFAQAAPTPIPESQAVREESQWQWGIGAGYSSLSWKTDEGILKADLDFNPALSLLAEIRNQAPNSFGSQFGISYDFERELDQGTITYATTTLNIPSGNSLSIQMTTIYANLVYQWDSFYLPIGLNWSRVKLKAVNGTNTSSKTDGGLGVQLGFGWAFNRMLSTELNFKGVRADLGIQDNVGNSTILEGNINTVHWLFKYHF